MNNIMICKEIFNKQKIDIMRNKQQLIILGIFPCMSLLYKMIDHETTSFYLFMLMCSIMVPITCMSSTVSEENDKGTLRSLIYAGTHAYQYFIGVGLCIGFLTFISVCLIGIISGESTDTSLVLGVMSISIIQSLLIGALIGIVTKRQINVSAMSAPSSLILGMIPVIGSSSNSIHRITRFLYSQVVLDIVIKRHYDVNQIIILIINVIILFVTFVTFYSKNIIISK